MPSLADDSMESACENKKEEEFYLSSLPYAAILASVVTRRASKLAFEEKKRAMTSPDVIVKLGAAFESVDT